MRVFFCLIKAVAECDEANCKRIKPDEDCKELASVSAFCDDKGHIISLYIQKRKKNEKKKKKKKNSLATTWFFFFFFFFSETSPTRRSVEMVVSQIVSQNSHCLPNCALPLPFAFLHFLLTRSQTHYPPQGQTTDWHSA
jgi:hypothetical protein